MSDKVEIKLDYSVELDGKQVNVVAMRRPKVRDMLATDNATGGDAAKELMLFASLTQWPKSVIEELDLKDYRKLQEAYQDFLD